ncbi:lipid A biosynthesis lauroyl acyltransferase [Saccharobesus litoralis]|uniref:Lipid A biosynthesis acyltransferase n=1 Tax=Saccharobesus litoralis TaxID=2172099 RepID=A0A2S0VXT2_9ALTE|nr:LpxL/LpxP family Kdo(2)-lipid IV(A) lauroyl/palmitoleoyl acyltransferase [Saccharobesus litoralis]AWB69036.1 lipid A biosynthesis lauroyl acyltransferase [Saccharobesus litoralis]
MVQAPTFSWSFLLPKYWINWLGIFILYALSWLPYRVIIVLGKLAGLIMYKLVKKRVHITRRNLEICFPEKTEQEREKLVVENFKSTGIALFETAIGWWWPTWRVKRLGQVTGIEHIAEAKQAGKGVIIVTHHMLCLEVCNRLLGLSNPNIGFYRPNNNKVWDYFQYLGRSRDNNYQINKRDIRGLFKALKNNESICYFPDQDYGIKQSVFVPFFAEQHTCTTTATSSIASKSGCKLVQVSLHRHQDNSGYTVNLSPVIDNYPSGDPTTDAIKLNQLIEKAVLIAPEQYMWMHRRFKTRPQDAEINDLYS